MLKAVKKSKVRGAGGRYALVASEYNARYVDVMLRHAQAELERVGVENVEVVRVPGAFEIPVVAARLARATPACAAIICLGVIFQGETSHAQHIGEAVTQALAQIQIRSGVPIIHEVLLFTNEEQARVRCLTAKHNRGAEAAQTALKMAAVMAGLR